MLTTSKKTKNNVIQVFGRTEPQVPEMEVVVLGAMLLDKEALNEVIDILTPEAFYVDAHQIIYKAIKKLFIKDKGEIDVYTLIKELRTNGTLKKVGGIPYLCHLTDNVASAAHRGFLLNALFGKIQI